MPILAHRSIIRMSPNESIVHLQMRFNERVLAVGTGVLYQHLESLYIVTAWHNVVGRHTDTLETLDKVNCAVPNNLLATFSICSDAIGGYFRRSCVIDLEDEDSTFYFVHPEGYPRKDVVAIPIDIHKPYTTIFHLSTGEVRRMEMPLVLPMLEGGATQVVPIQRFFPDDEQARVDYLAWLGQADELFIPGYPRGITDYTGQPLWKRASVASSLTLGWEGQPKFLVDCASRQGMSGSPVLMYSKTGTMPFGSAAYSHNRPVAIFAGVYSGRIGNVDALEAQIGVVWNWTVVDDVISSATYGDHSNFFFAGAHEVENAIKARWPSISGWNESVLDKTKNHRYRLHGDIMKDLNGRISSKDLVEGVVDFARAQLGSKI